MQPEDPRVSPTLGVPPRDVAPQPSPVQPSAAPNPSMQPSAPAPQPVQAQPQYTQPIPQAVQQQMPVQVQQSAAPVQQPVQSQQSVPVYAEPTSTPQAQPVQAAPAPQPQSPAPQPFAQEQQELDDENEYYDEELDDEQEEDDFSEAVNWQATEYIQRDKGTGWFVIFGIVMAVFVAVAIFLMNSPTFALVLGTITAVIIVFTKRPPRLISYSLTAKGLYIGDTLHRFADFKSFGVIHDGEEFSVTLIPTKRFMPSVTVYFPEESGEAIVDMLGTRLPMRELKLDMVDRIVRKLRL